MSNSNVTSLTESQHAELYLAVDQALADINQVILGKERVIKLAVACLLAKGHLLIEDLPGMGKTTLSHSLASVLGLDFARIQFTSDLLPADILGSAVYNRESSRFDFHPGPIFNQLLLADEVNRATPKTQSALLEAMAEYQVTIEGETRPLPEPFFVIATQNPSHQIGTFPLPESQLDRFLMKLELGYPDVADEKRLLSGDDRKAVINSLEPRMTTQELSACQAAVDKVTISETLLDYLLALLVASRESDFCEHGLSPRAGLALQRAAKAWAFLEHRNYCIPEDVQAVFHGVVEHRIGGTGKAQLNANNVTEQLLKSVSVPV